MAGLLHSCMQEKEPQQNLFSPPSQSATQLAVTLTLKRISRLTIEGMKTCQHQGASRWVTAPQMCREGRQFAAEVPCRCLAAGQCLPVPASPRWNGISSPRSEAARPGTTGTAWPPSWAAKMGWFVPGELGSTRPETPVLWQWQGHEVADTTCAVQVKAQSHLVSRCLRKKNVKHAGCWAAALTTLTGLLTRPGCLSSHCDLGALGHGSSLLLHPWDKKHASADRRYV